ncbi:MJ1255/VC2487 family glycosyltransferase [Pleionea litopenaei]|uniref:Glycosyltransferase family protein n=1 Tax=Pleionea litopenaei TaxID=3070815 RepID=A0AA51RSA0_9GAMM|nr:MJ1255/VC2487 family glycosyltransferase [Pleionea sp. HL-JVS1]WMS86627.1 glycosyltransferase family protein [Pleionea sp. HL-JVS1]
MKILYGVQGTGNGHITRARVMAKSFEKFGISVDWIFSGRSKDDYFDMQCFGDFQCFRGLTFAVENGKINIFKTAKQLNFSQLFRDAKNLAINHYDLIVSDFEPVSAWAARRAKKTSIGISHQSAFQYKIPKRGNNWFTQQVMNWFAPVDQAIGLHWHHFGQPILPPVIDVDAHTFLPEVDPKHILVYFPFQSLSNLVALVKPFDQHHFYIYHDVAEPIDQGHIHIRPFSRENFQSDLAKTRGVICGAGFELPSESVHLGKHLLIQPVGGQMEQLSNSLALQQLGLATVCQAFDHQILNQWLTNIAQQGHQNQRIQFPNTANALAQWIAEGAEPEQLNNLVDQLWHQAAPKLAVALS